jgi:outer membrane immunogenic protein
MKLLSGILGLTLTSAVALASANAADMYRAPAGGGYKDSYVPVASWTGFYAGVNGGYGWSEYDDQLARTSTVTFRGLSPEGGFGGGQIGYNWQGVLHPHVVLGIEADIQGADIQDKFVAASGPRTYESKIDYFGTVRGRIGYALDRTLVYFTGGFAYGGVNNSYSDPSNNNPNKSFKKDDTATGYVLGGGLEYKVTPAWSLKGEYQYINLGENDPVNTAGVSYKTFLGAGTVVHDDAFHTVRVGLNYHVGQGYEPLK